MQSIGVVSTKSSTDSLAKCTVDLVVFEVSGKGISHTCGWFRPWNMKPHVGKKRLLGQNPRWGRLESLRILRAVIAETGKLHGALLGTIQFGQMLPSQRIHSFARPKPISLATPTRSASILSFSISSAVNGIPVRSLCSCVICSSSPGK